MMTPPRPDSNEAWKNAGALDPLHAVASDKGKRVGESGAWDADSFLAKGREYVALTRPGWDGAKGPVLEIGCGSGRVTAALADQFDRVVGLDVSEHQLAKARELCPASNVQFVQGDGITLPGGPYGLVFSTQVIQHISRPAVPAIFAEIARVMAPDGRAVLHIPPPHLAAVIEDWRSLVSIRRFATRIAKTIHPKGNYSRRPWVEHDYNHYSAAQVERLASGAGLRVQDAFAFRPGFPRSMTYVLTRV